MKPNGKPAAASEILDRLPPQSLEAERGVIGSLLLDPALIDDVAAEVRAEDFYADAHRRLFGHLSAMRNAGQQIDSTLLVETLRTAGELEAVGGVAHLAEIVASVPVAAHAVYHARIVREKAARRSLIHAATSILRDAYDPFRTVDELLNDLEAAALAIATGNFVRQAKPVSVAVEKVLTRMQAIIDGRNEPGVKTGFYTFDRDFGGLFAGELSILAARPGVGKSALAAQIAQYVAGKGKPVYFASLEMGDDEAAQRLMCGAISLDSRMIRQARIDANDRSAMVEAGNQLAATGLYIDDRPELTVLDIRRECRRLKRKGLALAVIDYLQLITPENAKHDRHQQVGQITRALKNTARELEVPILCLAQLNRQAEKEDRPGLAHLRESGAIEQDADAVLFLFREPGQRGEGPHKAELIAAKNRNNATGTLTLNWEPTYTRFSDPEQPQPWTEFAQFGGRGRDYF